MSKPNKRVYIIICVLVILIGVGYIWYKPQQEPFTEVFGATQIAAKPYMECLNECEKIPGWQKLGNGRGSLLCAMSCNNYISGIVQNRALLSGMTEQNNIATTRYQDHLGKINRGSTHSGGTSNTNVSTVSSRTIKTCGPYEQNPSCYTVRGSESRINNYCRDECLFNKKYFGTNSINTDECIKLCTMNMMPNSSWGEWSWH